MFEILHDVYPLLIAAGLAAAIIPITGIKIESPEKMPYIARFIPEAFILLATFIALIGSIFTLWYVGQNFPWLIYISYGLILTSYILLLISFIFPFILVMIHPLWRSLFYSQFEEAQARDLEEIQMSEIDDNDTSTSNMTSIHNTSVSQKKPKP